MLDATKIFNNLHDDLFELDKLRRKYNNRVKPWQLLLQFVFVIWGSFMLLRWNVSGMEDFLFPDEQKKTVLITWGVSFIVSLMIFAIVHSVNLGKFKKLFAKKIGPKIIEGLGPDFTYDYEGKIPESDIDQTLLFDAYNRYSCQDLVKGTIGDTPILFAELKMELNTGSGEKQRTTKIFEGIFFEAELKTTFPTSIWLVPRTKYSRILKKEKQLVEIDHPALKKYKVYSDDEAKAKLVLQDFILQKLDDLDKKLDKEKITFGKIRYHFEGNMIQMGVPSLKGFLEPRLGRTMLDEKFIEEQVVLLNAISSLMNDLTLK